MKSGLWLAYDNHELRIHWCLLILPWTMKKLWKDTGLMANITCLVVQVGTAITKREVGLLKAPRYPFFRMSQFFNGSQQPRLPRYA
jgi:hypothetical protein